MEAPVTANELAARRINDLTKNIKELNDNIKEYDKWIRDEENKPEKDQKKESIKEWRETIKERRETIKSLRKALDNEVGRAQEAEKILSHDMKQLSLQQTIRQSVRAAIPLLARVPRLSETSPSTRTGHEPASIIVGKPATLSSVGSPRRPIESSIWTRQRKANVVVFDWSSEASIVDLVKDFLSDVLYECGLSEFLTLTPEMGTFELRPDLWVLRVAGMPVGVVEVKKPGKDVLDHENVLGEVYDYLLHLPNFYGAKQMIGILTTYREWRVCWLDNSETQNLMKADEILEEKGPTTPQKNAMTEKKDGSPPGLTPSKKRTDYHSVTKVEEKEDNEDAIVKKIEPSKREMFASRIWNTEKENVFPLVASALLKMSRVRHEGFDHPFDQLGTRTLLRLDEKSFYWDRLDSKKVGNGKWDCVPNAATKNLYLLEDLGTGSTGHVWLACSVGGAVCVLKFMAKGKDNPKVLEDECKCWHKIYPSLAKYVRVAEFCGRKALVMPHFDTPKRDKETLTLVESTLHQSFGVKELKHPDVRWRNIGVSRDADGSLKAIVFDLVGVKTPRPNSTWIAKAIQRLRESVM